MKNIIASIIVALTFNRVRFMRSGDGKVNSLRWVWTPWTYRFAHGGWIRTNADWLWRFRNGTNYNFADDGFSRRDPLPDTAGAQVWQKD